MTNSDIGGRLRQAREQRGWSLADTARLTRLSPAVLRAIERNDFDSLPAGMYRKAYLRTLAVELGLDPRQIAADYDALRGSSAEPRIPLNASPTASDPLIEELTPSGRRNAVTLAVLAALSVAWFTLGPEASPPPNPSVDHSAAASPSELSVTSADAVRAVAAPDAQEISLGDATPAASPAALKVELTTAGPCWVAAESDGERVVYGLIQPGERVVVEGHRRISLRLGDAGAVRLSINDGPKRTPGADGEVVDLDVTSDAVHALNGDVIS
jgi:cytoskeletal protein RodZ